MFDTPTTTLIRAIHDEVCRGISRDETGTRVRVATRLLEAASRGERTADGLRTVGRSALSEEASRAA